jgi:PAS domain S-box-containing protein
MAMVRAITQRKAALDRARREAEAFVEIQQDLTTTLELEPVLKKIARHARLLSASDLAYIAPFDGETGAATIVALDGERTDVLRGLRIEPGRGLGGRALSTLRPCRTWNYTEDPNLQGHYMDEAAAEGIVGTLAVPMILDEELIGLIYVANRSARTFTEEDEAILRRLAVPAALTIRNLRLVSQLAQDRDLLIAQSSELARSAGQLRGIVEAASDGILTIDPHGWITSANPAAEAMFGYDPDALLERNLQALIPKPAGDDPCEPLWTADAVSGGRRRELEGIRRDGARFPIELSASCVGIGSDRFFALVVRDITERKRADEARALLASIVESSDDAIIGGSLDGRIVSWNPGAERIYGYSAGEATGQLMSFLIPPDRADEVRQIVEAIRRGEGVENHETVRLRKDGTQIDVSLTISPIRDAAGVVTGVSSVARDISKRKAIERMKDEFIGTVSHELRTPLAAIKGHIELVLDGDAGPVTDLQRQFLGVASQNTDRLGALINDLLDVEKIAAGKIQLRADRVDLAGVLRDVAATFRLEAEQKGLAFRGEVGPLPVVVGDRDRLIQVFSNLVSNAVKYTPAGEVGISAGLAERHVEVVVYDTGIGMTPEEQRQLFTKFFRSQDTVVRDAGGTGLGLVIARGIVERHGGTITVTSEKGAGTLFRVLLPAASAANDDLAPAEPGQATVLVVEDTAALRDLLLEQVRRMGHRGVGTADGAEGLALARRLSPDLILLDILMPSPDGWEVLARLKRDPATRRIPVLVHTIVEDRERGLQLGALDYLVKPVEASRLRQAILAALADRPAPLFVVDPDPAVGERLARELRGVASLVGQAGSLAEARALRPIAPAVILLSRQLPDGDAGELVRAWRRDPAFRDAAILLIGEWPRDAETPDEGTLLRVQSADGAHVSEADLAGQVRSVIERWRRARDGTDPSG